MKYLRKFESCSDLRTELKSDSLPSENVNLIDHDVIFSAKLQEMGSEPLEFLINDNGTSDYNGFATGTSAQALNTLTGTMLSKLQDGCIIEIKVNNGDWLLIDSYTGSGAVDDYWWHFKYKGDTIVSRHYWESSNLDKDAIKVLNQYLTGTYYLQILDYKCIEDSQLS